MSSREQVNIHEAKTHLSRLVDRVAGGEGDIVIARAGKPAALLTRMPVEVQRRIPGALKGKLRIADDFDAPLPDAVLDAFEGKS